MKGTGFFRSKEREDLKCIVLWKRVNRNYNKMIQYKTRILSGCLSVSGPAGEERQIPEKIGGESARGGRGCLTTRELLFKPRLRSSAVGGARTRRCGVSPFSPRPVHQG